MGVLYPIFLVLNVAQIEYNNKEISRFSLKRTRFRTQIVMRFFYFKNLYHYFRSGAKLYFTLNIALQVYEGFWWCIATELPRSKGSFKVNLLLYLCTSLNALSCILLNPLFNCLLWSIQIGKQYLNWDMLY